jgi:TetR/AcrR family transcriptional regulator, cholesterol catabolism regulator
MQSDGAQYPLFYIYIRENLNRITGARAQWSRHMRKVNQDSVDLVIAIIEQGYADGTLRRIGPAPIVAYGLFGIVGWTHRWFRPDRSDTDAGAIAKTYAQLVLGGLEATPGGGSGR